MVKNSFIIRGGQDAMTVRLVVGLNFDRRELLLFFEFLHVNLEHMPTPRPAIKVPERAAPPVHAARQTRPERWCLAAWYLQHGEALAGGVNVFAMGA